MIVNSLTEDNNVYDKYMSMAQKEAIYPTKKAEENGNGYDKYLSEAQRTRNDVTKKENDSANSNDLLVNDEDEILTSDDEILGNMKTIGGIEESENELIIENKMTVVQKSQMIMIMIVWL